MSEDGIDTATGASTGRGPSRVPMVLSCAVAVIALVGGVLATAAVGGSTDEAEASDEANTEEAEAEPGGEVFLEPLQSFGTDPFFEDTTAMVAVEPISIGQRTEVLRAAEENRQPTQAISGADPGLYGGTRDNARCDRLALVGFLEQNPEKAAAWPRFKAST